MSIKYSIVFFLLFFITGLSVNYGQNIRVGVYNVENLFDTIDDPNKADEDFTPSGKLQWNTAKYYTLSIFVFK